MGWMRCVEGKVGGERDEWMDVMIWNEQMDETDG